MSGFAGGALGVISPALAVKLLNHAFLYQAMPQPMAVYVALYTSTTGAGMEVLASGGTGYIRQPAVFGPAGGAPVMISNSAIVEWAPAAAPWGTIIAGGIFDDPVSGNFYGWGNILAADGVTPIQVPINTGSIFVIPAGQLVIGIT